MKRFLIILFFAFTLVTYGQLPTIHPGTVTIGTVPEATATDSILTINQNGLIGHIPKSELGGGELIKVDDGSGYSWRLQGYDANRFSNIGLNSVDLTTISVSNTDLNYGISGDYGFSVGPANKLIGGSNHIAIGPSNIVTGQYNNMALGAVNNVDGYVSNFAIGIENTITQGYGSGAIGSFNSVNHNIQGRGVAIGHNNVISERGSSAFGMALISKSRYTVALGVANTNYPEVADEATKPILVVGTGTVNTPAGPWTANVRRDGFIVRHNGVVEAPELTTAKIDAGADRTLVTKEWVAANAGGGTPTLAEVLEEDYNAGFWPIYMQGGDLLMSNYSEEPLGGLVSLGYALQLNLLSASTNSYTRIEDNNLTLNNTNNYNVTIKANPAEATPSFTELIVEPGNGTIATREWTSNALDNQITPLTAKGTNFNTQKFFATNNTNQGATTHNLLPSFFVGNNTFDESERQDLSIYEGSLYFRYVPFDVSSEADIEFSFAGNNHIMADASGNDILYYEIEYTLLFKEAVTDTYTIIATVKRFNANESVSYSYIEIDGQDYTNNGNLDFEITSTHNDALIAVTVFKADLKRVN